MENEKEFWTKDRLWRLLADARYKSAISNITLSEIIDEFLTEYKRDGSVDGLDIFWTDEEVHSFINYLRPDCAPYTMMDKVKEYKRKKASQQRIADYRFHEMSKSGGKERCLTPDEQQLYDVLWKRLEGELKKNMDKLRDQAVLPRDRKVDYVSFEKVEFLLRQWFGPQIDNEMIDYLRSNK